MILAFFNILIIVIINGVFISSEYALSRFRMIYEDENPVKSKFLNFIFRFIYRNYERFATLGNIGIVTCGISIGWISKEVAHKLIFQLLSIFQIQSNWQMNEYLSLIITMVIIITFYLIFGYYLPKTLGKKYPYETSIVVSIPLYSLYLMFFPIIFIVSKISSSFFHFLDLSLPGNEPKTSDEELMYLIEESSKQGSINESDHKIIENVFEFQDTSASEIMIPRNKVVGIEISQGIEEVMEMIVEQGYSRLPVYEKTLDKIIGIIYSKDLISISLNKNLIIIQDVIRKPFFISEDTKINLLLREFQKNRLHIAIVLDNFGGTAGIVTLEDILEELVGEIVDEYDEESKPFEVSANGDYTINAMTPISEANEILPFEFLESDDYNTLAGFILRKTGYIPEENEIIKFEDFEIQIQKRTKRKIELISIIKIARGVH